MAGILSTPSNLYVMYTELMERSDPRVEGYPLMSSPVPSIILSIAYVVIVQWAGPWFMQNRKPYDLRNAMVVYNLAMVVLSGYTFVEFGLVGWLTGYSFSCQPVDYSWSPKALRMVAVCWLFFISKFIEFMDTIFFILRKKNNQVSFLHVFHHGIMPLSWWCGVKFVPGGFGTFHGWLNSLIHFVMYTYYGLSAMGPHMQKYLWWKKYMTKMQMIQFIIVCMHSGQLLFMSDCNYPQLFVVWIGLYAVIFLVMFADFYIKAYRKGHQKGANKVQNGDLKKGDFSNGDIANGLKQD